jgi:hypothetical protein
MPLWTEPGFYARSPRNGKAGVVPHGFAMRSSPKDNHTLGTHNLLTGRAASGTCPLVPDQAGGLDGQLIRILSPASVRAISTSSARPAITARPSSAGTGGRPPGGLPCASLPLT